VHAGLEPGVTDPARMQRKVLQNIRTWDGKGVNLNRQGEDPPWFECVTPSKTIVFGHWAERGLVDLPRFKGLDTGCVYGREMTAWCPEEKKFHHIPARRVYAAVE
jgi:bis(5'-nucleosyl)-tetraphosphatase (symmetrical)